MRIGAIVLKLRLAKTRFGSLIGGASELEKVMSGTLLKDMAFVIPLAEDCAPNQYDPIINQKITERFGVIVALANDSTDKDKLGLKAYDMIHTIRDEIFKGLLGWQMDDAESIVTYRGGRILDVNAGYLWYQFEFEFTSRLTSFPVEDLSQGIAGLETHDVDETPPTVFKTLYTNYILSPDGRLPYTGELPLADGYPDVLIPDSAQWIDMTQDPNAGEFAIAYGSGFDFYTGG